METTITTNYDLSTKIESGKKVEKSLRQLPENLLPEKGKAGTKKAGKKQSDLEVRLSILQNAYEQFLEAGGLAQFERFEAFERGLKQGYLTIVLHNTNACPKCQMWTSQTVCPNCKTQLGRESEMAENANLKPIEQAFTCHGCDAEIIINQDDPKRCVFEWVDTKTSGSNLYCYDCDDILIQDGVLPNAKKKMEVQS